MNDSSKKGKKTKENIIWKEEEIDGLMISVAEIEKEPTSDSLSNEDNEEIEISELIPNKKQKVENESKTLMGLTSLKRNFEDSENNIEGKNNVKNDGKSSRKHRKATVPIYDAFSENEDGYFFTEPDVESSGDDEEPEYQPTEELRKRRNNLLKKKLEERKMKNGKISSIPPKNRSNESRRKTSRNSEKEDKQNISYPKKDAFTSTNFEDNSSFSTFDNTVYRIPSNQNNLFTNVGTVEVDTKNIKESDVSKQGLSETKFPLFKTDLSTHRTVWKRCSIHAAIASYIFLHQHFEYGKGNVKPKCPMYSLDPTLEARLLKKSTLENISIGNELLNQNQRSNRIFFEPTNQLQNKQQNNIQCHQEHHQKNYISPCPISRSNNFQQNNHKSSTPKPETNIRQRPFSNNSSRFPPNSPFLFSPNFLIPKNNSPYNQYPLSHQHSLNSSVKISEPNLSSKNQGKLPPPQSLSIFKSNKKSLNFITQSPTINFPLMRSVGTHPTQMLNPPLPPPPPPPPPPPALKNFDSKNVDSKNVDSYKLRPININDKI